MHTSEARGGGGGRGWQGGASNGGVGQPPTHTQPVTVRPAGQGGNPCNSNKPVLPTMATCSSRTCERSPLLCRSRGCFGGPSPTPPPPLWRSVVGGLPHTNCPTQSQHMAAPSPTPCGAQGRENVCTPYLGGGQGCRGQQSLPLLLGGTNLVCSGVVHEKKKQEPGRIRPLHIQLSSGMVGVGCGCDSGASCCCSWPGL